MSREAFEAWAPSTSEWSQWAKPAPFIGSAMDTAEADAGQPPPGIGSSAEADLCMVLELPGLESVRMGLALARNGYRPAPMINTTTGTGAAIIMGPVLSELRRGALDLASMNIPADALPVFMLDSRRNAPGYTPGPSTYDNRWMVFPQDFPSGNYLAARGIKRAVVITREVQLCNDLRHVLRRWQEAGIKIYLEIPGDGRKPDPIVVDRPSMFKLGWYRFLVAIGLKKNAAGGFGGWIPEPSQSGGFRGGGFA